MSTFGPAAPHRRPAVVAGIVAEATVLAALGAWWAAGGDAVLGVDVAVLSLLVCGGLAMAAWARSRLVRAEITERLLRLGSSPETASVLAALVDELGDPRLRVLFRDRDTDALFGADGHDAVPERAGARRIDLLPDARGATVLVEVDAARPLSPRAVPALDAAGLLLEQLRLQALLRRQLLQVRASRQRLVLAALDERRELEGRLHDGAQSSLFAAMAELSRARARSADPYVATVLRDSSRALEQAVRELRSIVRARVYPAGLREGGLGAALDAAAADLPIDLTVAGDGGAGVEEANAVALYLTAVDLLRAIADAGATEAALTLRERDGRCALEVRTDAVPPRLPVAALDRIAALEGTVADSADPGGHLIEVELPCAS